MPSAWEGASFTHNVGVLARLATGPVGTKLKFDSDNGKFDIEDRGTLSRTFSWDSVTSGTHFAAPMRGLLGEMQRRVTAGTLAPDSLEGAVTALLKLRKTYVGTDAKVQALDTVLQTVRGVLPMGRETVGKGEIVVDLRQRHLRHLVYAVRQRNYLEPSQKDVCHAFVIDWGRRILVRKPGLLAGKPTFGHSKKPVVAYAPAATLSRDEHIRMQKKVVRIAALQAEEQALIDQKKPTRSRFPVGTKYGDVEIIGGDRMEVGEFRRNVQGRDIFREIIQAPRTFRDARDERVMMVRLDGATKGGSHMLGLHLSGVGLRDVHLFDPNVGEFRFTDPAERSLWDFCDDLMTSLYTNEKGELLFNSWVVQRLALVAGSDSARLAAASLAGAR